MATKKIAMDQKLFAVLAGSLTSVNVTALCDELGMSRQTFYKYRRRFRDEGLEGLVERSRRPATSPNTIPSWLEDKIVRLRKELPDGENGATTIGFHLARSGITAPAASTIHRALRRRGLVTDQPDKRPRSSYQRFEYPRPNACWQTDATEWVIATGAASIMGMLDDHSRLAVAARAAHAATGHAAWDCFAHAAACYGLPARVLSDNGACFIGRKGEQAAFGRNLSALGVEHITSRPYHPQTCGKIERWHQTLKRWLTHQPLATDLHQLQTQLDDFRSYYNHQRPHRALSGATPAERYHASDRAGPAHTPLAGPIRIGEYTADHRGVIQPRPWRIGLGAAYANRRVTIINQGTRMLAFHDNRYIGIINIRPDKRYQRLEPPTHC
jgi:transposase InsO family protein